MCARGRVARPCTCVDQLMMILNCFRASAAAVACAQGMGLAGVVWAFLLGPLLVLWRVVGFFQINRPKVP